VVEEVGRVVFQAINHVVCGHETFSYVDYKIAAYSSQLHTLDDEDDQHVMNDNLERSLP
jgi:hypothetical protein